MTEHAKTSAHGNWCRPPSVITAATNKLEYIFLDVTSSKLSNLTFYVISCNLPTDMFALLFCFPSLLYVTDRIRDAIKESCMPMFKQARAIWHAAQFSENSRQSMAACGGHASAGRSRLMSTHGPFFSSQLPKPRSYEARGQSKHRTNRVARQEERPVFLTEHRIGKPSGYLITFHTRQCNAFEKTL
jgi:hypothetical protein